MSEICNHSNIAIADDKTVCCADCGELLDPVEVLDLFLDTQSFYRKKLSNLRLSVEQLEIDIARQKRDLKSGADEYKKLNLAIGAARSELADINQTIKERAPMMSDLLKELGESNAVG